MDKKEAKERTENEIKLFELLEKESEPNALTMAFVDHPCIMMLVGYFVLIIIANMALSLGYFEMNY